MCCAFLQWITTFRRSTKWTRHNKHFVSTLWPNFQVPFHTFYVSIEDLPTCCGSPISLSSPRKSTMGKNVRSISFFVEEEVQEKLENSPFAFVKTPKTKLCEQIQHCFPRIIFADTCNDAFFCRFYKKYSPLDSLLHHSRHYWQCTRRLLTAAPRFGAEIGLAHGLMIQSIDL